MAFIITGVISFDFLVNSLYLKNGLNKTLFINMIDRVSPFSRTPRKTIRLSEREVIEDINQPEADSLEDTVIESLRQKLRETERAIWMIDKKYGFLIDEAWDRYYELKKDIKELEGY